MYHSHDALDRSGGFARARLIAPLAHRDFRVLWMGMTASMIGDGVFLVAMAWETYLLWNAPVALSVVAIGMTVPTVVFLLAGGVVSDRYDRRRVMFCADVVRAVAVGAVAALALSGTLRFWELVTLVAIYGSGTAFFTPAFEAIVPDLVPKADLAAANSLDQLVRPIALRLAGPLFGGALVALNPGLAFSVDAASFGASAIAVLLVRPRLSTREGKVVESSFAAVKEGLSFVRQRVWLWGTLAAAAVSYLIFLGPTEVLLPYVVKNNLHGSADALGAVFAAGGVGAIGAAIWVGQRGHPRRDVTVMYVTWTLATLAIAGYGIATAVWQLMLACLVFNAFEAAGTIVWATIKQHHVPGGMLGRVSSLDWLISIGLVPISLALTAPVVAVVGVGATLVGAALIGSAVTFAALFLRGMRDIERDRGERRKGNEETVPTRTRRRATATAAN